MNTHMALLLAKDGRTTLPLEEVGAEFLGISDKRILSQKARHGELPIPAFRLEKKQKAPWLVSTKDLAELIDKKRNEAMQDWQQLQY